MHTGVLDITVVEQDETGKVLRESSNRINLRFSEKQYPAVLQITFRNSVQPQAGVVTLRVLVQDPVTAAIGSLILVPSSFAFKSAYGFCSLRKNKLIELRTERFDEADIRGVDITIHVRCKLLESIHQLRSDPQECRQLLFVIH